MCGKGRKTTYGSSYREFRKIEGLRNLDSIVFSEHAMITLNWLEKFQPQKTFYWPQNRQNVTIDTDDTAMSLML